MKTSMTDKNRNTHRLKLRKGDCLWQYKSCPNYLAGRTTILAEKSERFFKEAKDCQTCHKYTHFKFDILNCGEIQINKDAAIQGYILLISYYIDGKLRSVGYSDYLEDIGGFEFGILYPISEIDKITKERKPVSFFKSKNNKKTFTEMLGEDIKELSIKNQRKSA